MFNCCDPVPPLDCSRDKRFHSFLLPCRKRPAFSGDDGSREFVSPASSGEVMKPPLGADGAAKLLLRLKMLLVGMAGLRLDRRDDLELVHDRLLRDRNRPLGGPSVSKPYKRNNNMQLACDSRRKMRKEINERIVRLTKVLISPCKDVS